MPPELTNGKHAEFTRAIQETTTMNRTHVVALLSASLFLGTSAAMATLAIDHDRSVIRSASDPASCPPESCSIVVKTEAGGEPSRILSPTAATPAAEKPASRRSAVMVATSAQ